ncbi:hypothetical protein WAB17_07415 [Parerythrobacter aurantius]|uniref:hypothetical protein n=1 Tax=Parerythrobacter aurantius TaxID=3127706 RepID=UPI00324DECCD
MAQKLDFGDVVAIALVASAVGGLITATGFVSILFGFDKLSGDPGAFLLALLWGNLLGLAVSIVFAWPLGIAVGATANSIFGDSAGTAGCAGAFTASILFALAYGEEPIREALLFGIGITFTLFGALMAIAGRYYVLNRVAVFTR